MNDTPKILDDLRERVRSIEKNYNPDHLNLHFDIPIRTDPALFEDLYAVGLEAWNVIRVNQSRETLHWFYDFFVLIGSASVKILNDHTQNEYPKDVIERLTLLLVETSQMTNHRDFEGDIKSRNHEALANLLLAFHNYGDLRNIIFTKSEEMNDANVSNFVKWAIATIRRIENKSNVSSAQSK